MKELLELDPLMELDPAYVAWKTRLLQLKKENEMMRSYFEKIIDIQRLEGINNIEIFKNFYVLKEWSEGLEEELLLYKVNDFLIRNN